MCNFLLLENPVFMRYLYHLIRILLDSIFQLSQFPLSFRFDSMNKKTKPPFSLKSIENSSLFKRRVSNTTFIDNNEVSRQMLINYNRNHDKNDKTTNTLTQKNADKTTVDCRKVTATTELGRNSMESQLGKTLTFEINNGSVECCKIIQNVVKFLKSFNCLKLVTNELIKQTIYIHRLIFKKLNRGKRLITS